MVEESSRIASIITPWRARWYPAVILIALFISLFTSIYVSEGTSTFTGKLIGDYPEFYAVGKIILDNDIENLYTPKTQEKYQSIIMNISDGFVPFVYPPFFALFYAGFSSLPYILSFFVHLSLMILFLYFSIKILQPMAGWDKTYNFFIFAVLLLFYPVLRATLGGQNSPLTILLLSATWRSIEEKQDIIAGLCLGCLLFKPHFALPLAGLLLISGKWKIIGIFSIVGCIFYLISAKMLGWHWYQIWYHNADRVVQASMTIRSEMAISWIGIAKNLSGITPYAIKIGYIFSFLTIVYVTLFWLRRRHDSNYFSRFGLTSIAILLIPPHVYFYDTGILIFAYLSMLNKSIKFITLILAVVWLSGYSQIFAKRIGLSPIFIIVILTGIFVILANRKNSFFKS